LPFVTVYLLPGRTADQKKKASEEISKAMVKTLNTKSEDISIVFVEVAPQNWSEKGQMLSDLPR